MMPPVEDRRVPVKRVVDFADTVTCLAVLEDSCRQLFAAGGVNKKVMLFEMHTSEKLGTVSLTQGVTAVQLVRLAESVKLLVATFGGHVHGYGCAEGAPSVRSVSSGGLSTPRTSRPRPGFELTEEVGVSFGGSQVVPVNTLAASKRWHLADRRDGRTVPQRVSSSGHAPSPRGAPGGPESAMELLVRWGLADAFSHSPTLAQAEMAEV